MKTNYVIGETYYCGGKSLRLKRIDEDYTTYPLRCYDFDGKLHSFTSDGKAFSVDKNPSLSTSPTEFIAPKEKNFMSWEDIYKNATFKSLQNGAIELLPPAGEGKFYRIEGDGVYIEEVPNVEYNWRLSIDKAMDVYKQFPLTPKDCFFNTKKIQNQQIKVAIDLLKENGYTITKQY
jgi:hypothetical protein